jgi:proteasome lid subunit RPN8/RPN11
MLKISKSIHDDIIAHAQEGFPLEVCGILGGEEERVSVVYRMANTDQSNEHFMMDPKEQFAVVKDLRARGIEMLAIYHSHPESPARPSEEDIRLALTPNVAHVIVSLVDPAQPVLKGFRIGGGAIEPVPVEVVG